MRGEKKTILANGTNKVLKYHRDRWKSIFFSRQLILRLDTLLKTIGPNTLLFIVSSVKDRHGRCVRIEMQQFLLIFTLL